MAQPIDLEIVVKGVCGGCEFWTQFSPNDANLGTCKKVVLKHPMNAKEEDRIIEFGTDSIVLFHGLFGCVLHQPKEV